MNLSFSLFRCFLFNPPNINHKKNDFSISQISFQKYVPEEIKSGYALAVIDILRMLTFYINGKD